MDFCFFSKRLQSLGFAELCRQLRAAGFGGVDLTVRPGGHVEPGEVRARLPEAATALRSEGVEIRMLSTGITAVDEPGARDVLETAADLGIRWIKLGYYPYRGFGTLRQSLTEASARLRELAAAAGELELFLGCHNHSGNFVGAHLGHLGELVGPLDPEAVGIYFDPAHAVLEGGRRGWLQSLDGLADRVRMLALKELAAPPGGALDAVAMGSGNVSWGEVVAVLKRLAGQLGPVSVHGDIPGTPAAALELAAADLAFFRGLWEAAAIT